MTEPEPVRDAAGEKIRKGRYGTCPICGLLFRDPVQDVEPLKLATVPPGGFGGAPRFKLSELYHQLMRQQERVLEAHLDTHTMLEAAEVIVRLRRERDQLRESHKTQAALGPP